MLRRYFFASILIMVLLAGCAPKGVAQPAEVRALENPIPTALSEPSATAEITKSDVVPHDPPSSCLVTTPQDPAFVPPSPYDSLGFEDTFWYGSNSLWTALNQNGVWSGLPYNQNGYSQKVFWWREGYVWNEEPDPDLVVTGERLDAPAPPLDSSKGTNAYAADIGSAMLVGVDFPTLGCWKITGKYADAELSFVVWVTP
ncbi:MAG TPA: hypothetical protein VJ830_01070 [Anaerolineales bacterium]|nr:hypothetical protein [Anaerolineales bacterium]